MRYKVLEPCFKGGKLWAEGEEFESEIEYNSRALEKLPDDAPKAEKPKKEKPEKPAE